jgi:hypothetical protein
VSAEPALASDRGDRRDMSPSVLEEREQLRRAPTESSWGRRSRYSADPIKRPPVKQKNQPEGWSCLFQPRIRNSISFELKVVELDRSRPTKQRN